MSHFRVAGFAANDTHFAQLIDGIDALETEPISRWNDHFGWLEAISMVAFITCVAKKERFFIVATSTELAIRLHYGLFPGDARFQLHQTEMKLNRETQEKIVRYRYEIYKSEEILLLAMNEIKLGTYL